MYEEHVLKENLTGKFTLGTERECKICFERERFEVPFIVWIEQQEGQYALFSGETVFFCKPNENTEKLNALWLQPGDKIAICYTKTGLPFLYLDMAFDFKLAGMDYNLAINWKGRTQITIGGRKENSICLDDSVIASDYITICKVSNGYEIDATTTRYGIQINGFSTEEQKPVIREGEFFSFYGYAFHIREEVLYTTQNAVVITDLAFKKLGTQKNHLQYPKFKRNVRQKYKLPEESREILKPKEKEHIEEQNLLLTAMPMLINLLLMVVMRGAMGGGGIFVLYFAGTMLVSTGLSVVTFIDGRKKRKEKEENRINVYMSYLSQQEDALIKLRKKEKIVANQMNPTLDEYVGFVKDFDSRLFEKEKNDADYLAVRLGSGIQPSGCQVQFHQEEYIEIDDDLMNYPKVLHDKYQYIDNMPIMLELKGINAVGFVGIRTKLYQIAKNLLISYGASHFYRDLKMFLIMDSEDVPLFQWARWLQNTSNEDTGTRNFMYDDDSAKVSLEFLYSELSRRESYKSVAGLPDYIVFVYKSEVIRNHPVSEYVANANNLGFHFIFFEEYEELLNPECTKRIFLNSKDYCGYIQDAEDGQQIKEFRYTHITKEEAEECAKRLAGVYVDEVNLENSLTKNITLYELLDIMTPYDLNLAQRWKTSKIFESMAAPLGVKSGDEIVYLDLHEKYHGPHGLVAGTTGSGKSEILQSYILSMATLFHPYEVGFIIIDFKGGGMVNQFRELPHLIGAITNIDGKEIDRSLLSIRAELLKRQELFAEQNVNHINDYIRAYKEGHAVTPLPHLILIVDEFAELKSEQPEFMKELISAARIGRSLGVHLILATQKPSGVVNDQIWSNSKFKLCLKVQNKSDSNEVIKSPLAAEIREPGRAYLQVGNNEIFQLFQSAYSGAPAKNDGINNQKKFQICSVELSGKRKILYKQSPQNRQGGETQLDALVSYIYEYCKKEKIEKLPNICLPPLPESIAYNLEDYQKNGTDIKIPIGLVDDPSRQRQFTEEVNFSQNNIFLLGASMSGKTCMLQSIIYGLTSLYSPALVHIYILDFGSMILKNFDELNHVGGTIISTEDEKLKNFLKMIQENMAKRKQILSQMGLSSFSSYLEAGKQEMPQIVIILDNWVAFKGYYPDYAETMLNMIRDSVAVGISFVVTASQSSGIGFKLLSNFSKRIALHCNDTSEYTSIYEGCRMKPEDMPGRGIAEVNRHFYECQYYMSFAADKEYERVKLIKEYIKEINKQYPFDMAKAIPGIPQRVTEAFLLQQFGKDIREKYEVLLGIEYETIYIRKLNLLQIPVVSFIGHKDSAKNLYIQRLLTAILQHREAEPVDLYICDGIEPVFQNFAKAAQQYTQNPEDVDSILEQIHKKLATRQINISNQTEQIQKAAFILILIHSREGMLRIGEDKERLKKFKDMITTYKGLKIGIWFTDVENQSVSFGAPEIMKQIRDNKHYFIFEQAQNIKLTEVPTSIKRSKKGLDDEDVYYVNDTEFEKVRIISE